MKKSFAFLFLCFVFSLFIFSKCSDKEVDETCEKEVWYQDNDGDGYGNPDVSVMACERPTGYVKDNTDCDDNDMAVNPGAVEIPGDDIDNNCDGVNEDIACISDCSGKSCGDDGCGGSCGDCGVGFTCNEAGNCVACISDCSGKSCGDDGCGGSCGSCGVGFECVSGNCVPL